MRYVQRCSFLTDPFAEQTDQNYFHNTTKVVAHECVQKRVKNVPGSAKWPVAPDAVEGNNAGVCENGVAPPPTLEDRGAGKSTTIRQAAVILAASSLAALEVFLSSP
jgi:hypothetical protein